MPTFKAPIRVATETLSEADIDELQACLDRVPAPLEPLDVTMLDGFLCGVLLQPQPIAEAAWLVHLTDADGRALPASFDATRLHGLARRRYAELADAIGRRQWFDPWVFELSGLQGSDDPGDSGDASDADHADHVDNAPHETDAVYPWVAGFAAAHEFFPALMRLDARALTAPLALLYRHLDPDDLEDADDLLEEIESLEPPADLSAAVEELVRAVLLLADVSRPLAPSGRAPQRPAARRPQRR